MNDTELEKRQARAANETLVISKTDGGFRVYNPSNITHIYMVSGIPDSPKCNCPDFETHQSDPEWRCKHILAVLNQGKAPPAEKPATEDLQPPEERQNESKPSEPAEKKKTRVPRNGHSQMLIKRSISPDGYINSLSVEFISSVDTGAAEAVKDQAQKALMLQAEIAGEFLKANGNEKSKTQASERESDNGKETEQTQRNSDAAKHHATDSDAPSENAGAKDQDKANQHTEKSDSAVPAQLLNVAGMNTRGGWKLFINVQVNGKTAKLFGNKKELAEHVAAAGFPSVADHINQGMALYLPCRVVTKISQDGKYLNIEKVLPKGAGGQ